jgi:hypothetical protein
MKFEIDHKWLVFVSFLVAMFCNFANSFLGKLEDTWLWKELGKTSFLAQNYHFCKIERSKNLGQFISS